MAPPEPSVVLHIDESSESTAPPKGPLRELFFRLLRWLDSHTPFILVERIGVGRKSVERQMIARRCFPSKAWAKSGICGEFPQWVLSRLCAILQLPNGYVLPTDPLRLLFTPGYDDLCGLEAADYLQKEFGLTRTELNALLTRDVVARELIAALLGKTKGEC